jgi:hypothetical protein
LQTSISSTTLRNAALEDGLVGAGRIEAAQLLAGHFEVGELVLVDEDRAVLVQGDDDQADGLTAGCVGRGLGELDVDASLDEGRNDHEDDEKDEEHVAQRDDIRFSFRHNGLLVES